MTQDIQVGEWVAHERYPEIHGKVIWAGEFAAEVQWSRYGVGIHSKDELIRVVPATHEEVEAAAPQTKRNPRPGTSDSRRQRFHKMWVRLGLPVAGRDDRAAAK